MKDRLYQLLPGFLRFRDWYEGEPLHALMAVLESQYETLEEDLGKLNDDWFIETCQDWLAPYLGDLVGVRGLEQPEAWVPTQRARIANTLIYRQLKGTTAVLARAARDVTGWPCLAVPFFELLAISQNLGHVRPGRGGTVDVRDRAALDRLGGAFDQLAHRPQISGAAATSAASTTAGGPREGYNLPRLGLFFWRLRNYPVRGRTAHRVAPGCFTFHPLGIDQPLFSRLRAADPLTEDLRQSVGEGQVPGPIRRQALAEELEARRAGRRPATDYLGAPPAFEVLDPATRTLIPSSQIEVTDLSQWRRPAAGRKVAGGSQAVRIAVDPELGRLAFPADAIPGEVRVSYSYGCGGDLGGGPYQRSEIEALEAGADAPPTRLAAPSPAEEEPVFARLLEALDAWPADAEVAHIQIADSVTYGGSAGLDLELELRAGCWLILEAAAGAAPCFIGNLRVSAADSATGSRLTIAGLTLGGKIAIEGPVQLDLRHCTVQPVQSSASSKTRAPESCIEVIGDPSPAATVRIDSSIVGSLWLAAGISSLEVVDSIVDGGSQLAIAGDASGIAGPTTVIARSTLFGAVAVTRLLSAEDVLFTVPVVVQRRHEGVMRHCYLPNGSSTPRRELCQPDLALEEAAGELEIAEVLARLLPSFASRTYGLPGYAQLSRRCPREIRVGAANGCEMGVFQSSRNAFREANLPAILEEYLPWGLEPRIFYVT